jgi:hypothetical protein
MTIKSIIIQFLPTEENRSADKRRRDRLTCGVPTDGRVIKCVAVVEVTSPRATSNYNDLVTILRFIVNIGDGL